MIAPITNGASTTPAYRVGDERLIRVTTGAARKINSLLGRQGRPGGVLRVAVVGGGCSGLQYKMDLQRSEEHTSELQSRGHLVCRLLLEKKNTGKGGSRPHRGHVKTGVDHSALV